MFSLVVGRQSLEGSREAKEEEGQPLDARLPIEEDEGPSRKNPRRDSLWHFRGYFWVHIDRREERDLSKRDGSSGRRAVGERRRERRRRT